MECLWLPLQDRGAHRHSNCPLLTLTCLRRRYRMPLYTCLPFPSPLVRCFLLNSSLVSLNLLERQLTSLEGLLPMVQLTSISTLLTSLERGDPRILSSLPHPPILFSRSRKMQGIGMQWLKQIRGLVLVHPRSSKPGKSVQQWGGVGCGSIIELGW